MRNLKPKPKIISQSNTQLAIVLTVLFFFDHNVSSLMCQAPEFHLKKPPAFNYDCIILGVCVIFCGILGLPPVCGLIPQCPLHTGALATKEIQIDGVTGDEFAGKRIM